MPMHLLLFNEKITINGIMKSLSINQFNILSKFLFICIFFTACGGGSDTNDVPNNIYAAPTIEIENNITAKSGAFSVIEWQINSEDKKLTLRLKQISGEQDIEITLSDLEKGKAYFNAPLVDSSNTDYQFELTVTNSQGLSTTSLIVLNISVVAPVFKQPSSIFELEVNDSVIDISKIYSVGSYLIVESYSNSERSAKILLWDDGKLVEVNDIDPVYYQQGVIFYDFNDDGLKDAFYLKEFDIGDCEPQEYDANTFLMVKIATETNSFQEASLTHLGCSGWSTHYSLKGVMDINDDGYADINMSVLYDEGGESFSSWLLFDIDLNEYIGSPLYNSEYIDYFNFGFSIDKKLVDINHDQLTDILSIKDIYECEQRGRVCGSLQYQLKLENKNYEQSQSLLIDGEYTEFDIRGQYQMYDINQNGVDDIAINASSSKEEDDELTHTHWFELTENGDFKRHLIKKLPEYYYDIFATENTYFVDINSVGFIKYKYSDLLKSPVIDEVQAFPEMPSNIIFVDIDGDLDLDALSIEGNHIMMSENDFQK